MFCSIAFPTLWKEKLFIYPPPLRRFASFTPLYPLEFPWPSVGGGMDIFWNHTLGGNFPKFSFFHPITEPHRVKSNCEFLYQVVNTTSTVAISIALLVLPGKQTYIPAKKIWVAKGPAKYKIRPIEPKRIWEQLQNAGSVGHAVMRANL